MAIFDFLRSLFGDDSNQGQGSSNSDQLITSQRASSCFSRFEYNTATRDLYITFSKDGSSYVFHGVEPAAVKAVLEAPSQGAAFNYIIRNRYAYS